MLHLLTGRMAGHTKNIRDAASVAALLHACLAGSEWLSVNDIIKLIHDVVGRLRRALAEEDSDDEWPYPPPPLPPPSPPPPSSPPPSPPPPAAAAAEGTLGPLVVRVLLSERSAQAPDDIMNEL